MRSGGGLVTLQGNPTEGYPYGNGSEGGCRRAGSVALRAMT